LGRNPIADTRLVQQLLASKGFGAGATDGLVGPRTGAAIAAFLQTQGTSPTHAIDAGLLGAVLGS
jgi:peptidoglycan hydrolase-like protein with peptidoglycan-binding domain